MKASTRRWPLESIYVGNHIVIYIDFTCHTGKIPAGLASFGGGVVRTTPLVGLGIGLGIWLGKFCSGQGASAATDAGAGKGGGLMGPGWAITNPGVCTGMELAGVPGLGPSELAGEAELGFGARTTRVGGPGNGITGSTGLAGPGGGEGSRPSKSSSLTGPVLDEDALYCSC